MNRIASLSAFCAGLLASTACSTPGDATPGSAGKVSFGYQTDFSGTDDGDCLFGCALDRAVVPGSTHVISVDGDGDVRAVSSTNEAVAKFTLQVDCTCTRETDRASEGSSTSSNGTCDPGWTRTCKPRVTFAAGDPGEANLILLDAARAVIDRTTLHVERPASAELVCLQNKQEVPLHPFSLTDADSPTIVAHFRSATGDLLRTSGAVEWSSADGAVADFSAWYPQNPLQGGSTVSLELLHAGTTTIHAKVGTVEATSPVIVQAGP